MREFTTIIEVDERGRMLMPLAMRKALGIENKKALVQMSISLVAKNEESENPQIPTETPVLAFA